MIKKIDFVNSTMVGMLQSSNTGSPIFDEGGNAILAHKIKKNLKEEFSINVDVHSVDVDDLKVDQSNETLILINKKVLKVADIAVDALGKNYLIYDQLELRKPEFKEFVKRVSQKIEA
jgi:hypothetical protein